MGSRNKLLMRIGETTVIERVVRTAIAANIGDVITVVGSDRQRVSAVLDRLPTEVVFNAAYEEGMGSSIRAGVRAAGPDRAGYAVCVGDLPEIHVATFQTLARALGENPRAIVLPNHSGMDGHPVFFGARFYESLARLGGDVGGRRLIEQHPDAVIRLQVTNSGISRDIDTEEDWERFTS